ncbi:hypothetical protein X741_33120 [Mesorhizobium sp. LNHC229A00]|nr:hypothetical protein X741_33120 [Mesorhizobium sp. LNHC229A00]
MDAPDRIDPAILKHPGIGLPTLGKVHRISKPSSRRYSINRGWNNIIVSAQHGRCALFEEATPVADQAVEPTQLVVKLGTRGRISVWQIETTDDESADLRLDIAAMAVIRVAGKPASTLDGARSASEDSDAVVGFLAVPDCTIPSVADRLGRKLLVRGFEFLKTNDVITRGLEPREEDRQATIDTVHIEGGDADHRLRASYFLSLSSTFLRLLPADFTADLTSTLLAPVLLASYFTS